MAWSGFKKALADDPAGVSEVLTQGEKAIPVSGQRAAIASPSVAEELAHVIEIESRWNPQAQNPQTHATGLIQFMPSTALSLGTNVHELAGMNLGQQAPYVAKYFSRIQDPAVHVGDIYLMVFAPAFGGSHGDTDVIFDVGTQGWKQNPGLRGPGNGPITVGSVRRKGTPPPGGLPAVTTFPGKGKPPPSPPGLLQGTSSWLLLLLAAMVLLDERKRIL